jgi:hypothetical protein
MNRDFKGIWIPREIWLRNDISCQERCLWAEIHSLFDREKGGCYASNQYLMDFVGVKERMLQIMISNLKAKGLLVEVSFNGRTRVIKAVLPPEDFSPCGAEVQYIAGQGCNKMHPSGAENCTPLIYRDKSLDKSIDSSLKVPMEPMPAEAGEMEIKHSSSEKPKREKSEFSPHVREVATQLTNIFISHDSEYSPPKNLTPFLVEVDFLLRIDKREPEKIYDILNWALSDSFWRAKMFKPNPAKYLRDKYLQLKNTMESQSASPKKDRKFAPSSNDKRAVEIMQEMKKRAL